MSKFTVGNKITHNAVFVVFNNNNMKYILLHLSDTAVLLTKNAIKAVKKMVFSVLRQTLKIKKMNTDFHA